MCGNIKEQIQIISNRQEFYDDKEINSSRIHTTINMHVLNTNLPNIFIYKRKDKYQFMNS